MNKKLQKTLLLGVALLIGLPAQGMKPGNGVGEILTFRIIAVIVSLLNSSEEFFRMIWGDHDEQTSNSAVEADKERNNNDDPKSNSLMYFDSLIPSIVWSSRNTPLHLAAEYGNLEAIQVLIKRGADMNAVNNDGWKIL